MLVIAYIHKYWKNANIISFEFEWINIKAWTL